MGLEEFWLIAFLVVTLIGIGIISLIRQKVVEHRFKMEWLADQSVDRMIEVYNTKPLHWVDDSHASIEVRRMYRNGICAGWVNFEVSNNDLLAVIILEPKPNNELIDNAYLIKKKFGEHGIQAKVLSSLCRRR